MPNGVQVDYRYDLFGNRVEKVVSTTTVTTTRYVYSGEDIIGILDGNNTVVSRVLPGPGIDEPLLIVTGNNEAYLYADGLGSIIAVADAGAVLRETIEYGAYGKTVYKDAVTGSTSTVSYTGNPYGYTGREPDGETGLCYYRARYYDVEAGRFIQSDPIGFEGGDTNLYAYVADNPLSSIDPSGLAEIKVSLSDDTLTVYDDKGIELMKANIIHGCPNSKTPTGKFKLEPWKENHTSPAWKKDSLTPWDKSFWGYNVFGPWFVPLINGDGVAIHGTVGPRIPFFWYRYLPTRFGSCSHGCIRMTNPDIIKLHDLLPKIEGTRVTISE